MGILAGLRYLPHLLLGLPVGVLVDRWPRRPVLLLSDLGQALLLGTIPALALLNGLRIEALYAVAVLTGLLALLADVAGSAYLPTLVGRTHLLAANSATALSQSVATTLGPALAGLLVQLAVSPTGDRARRPLVCGIRWAYSSHPTRRVRPTTAGSGGDRFVPSSPKGCA